MITPSMAAAAVSTGIMLVFLWVLIFWCYRVYRIDLYRERMFALREELFVLALDGKIQFSDPAYELLRSTLNGFIRFGHQVSLIDYFVVARSFTRQLAQNPEESFSHRFDSAVADISEDVQPKLRKIARKMNLFTFEQMVIMSPLVVLSVVPFLVLLIAGFAGFELSRWMLSWRWIGRSMEPVDSAALRLGRAGDRFLAST